MGQPSHKLFQQLEQRLGRPVANVSFAMMRRYLRSAEKRGIDMMHTARTFDHYRKVFYGGVSEQQLLQELSGQTIVDVGCGYTPYAVDSMFRACHRADLEFYGVDPLLAGHRQIGLKEILVSAGTGGSVRFDKNPPGLDKALPASAQDMPFADESIDEILCSYLLFVWIRSEAALVDIFTEWLRVLKPGGVIKLFPLYEWELLEVNTSRLRKLLNQFSIEQSFVHGRGDPRVMPSMLTVMTKDSTGRA